MLQAYATDAPMRERYLRINGITHAEVWDCEDDEGYQLVICTKPGCGWRESPVFGTPGQCVAWLRNTCRCMELEIR